MPEHELPPNHQDWPSNCYELLGVAREADRTTLRRAYTQLIRRYKPEHAPEQFRLIRAAYDSALQFVEWREAYEKHAAQADDDDESETESGPRVSIESIPLICYRRAGRLITPNRILALSPRHTPSPGPTSKRSSIIVGNKP